MHQHLGQAPGRRPALQASPEGFDTPMVHQICELRSRVAGTWALTPVVSVQVRGGSPDSRIQERVISQRSCRGAGCRAHSNRPQRSPDLPAGHRRKRRTQERVDIACTWSDAGTGKRRWLETSWLPVRAGGMWDRDPLAPPLLSSQRGLRHERRPLLHQAARSLMGSGSTSINRRLQGLNSAALAQR